MDKSNFPGIWHLVIFVVIFAGMIALFDKQRQEKPPMCLAVVRFKGGEEMFLYEIHEDMLRYEDGKYKLYDTWISRGEEEMVVELVPPNEVNIIKSKIFKSEEGAVDRLRKNGWNRLKSSE